MTIPHEGLVLSEGWRYWLACAIDGEGSISLRAWSDFSKFAVYVHVFGTHEGFVRTAERITGTGKVYCRIRANKDARKPMYYWRVAARRAGSVLEQIRPYLIIKQEHCDVALELLERGTYRSRPRAGRGRIKSLTPEEVEIRKALWWRMRILNKDRIPSMRDVVA